MAFPFEGITTVYVLRELHGTSLVYCSHIPSKYTLVPLLIHSDVLVSGYLFIGNRIIGNL